MAFLQGQAVRVWDDGVQFDQTVHWGIGFLADGQCEVLGVWLAPDAGAQPWRAVFEDLAVRGVEKVRLVACSEPAEVRAGLRVAYPGAAVLPSVGHLLAQSLAQMAPRDRGRAADALGAIGAAPTAASARAALADVEAGRWGALYPAVVERWRAVLEQLAPLHALTPPLRRVVLSGDGTFRRLGQSLNWAVSRHGCFPDRSAAALFLADALARAEASLDACRTDAGALTEHNNQKWGIMSVVEVPGL